MLSTALLTAIFVCIVGMGAYLLYMILKHRKRDDLLSKIEKTDGSQQVQAISDNPIYKETKETVANLRIGLDEFKELVDNCFSSRSMSSRERLKAKCEELFPAMYDALNKSRDAALELLRAVCAKTNSNPPLAEFHKPSKTLSAPPSDNHSPSSKLLRIDGLVRRIQVITDGVGPIIAHFYVALTLESEQARLDEATAHATSLVHHLDDSIYELEKIERLILNVTLQNGRQ